MEVEHQQGEPMYPQKHHTKARLIDLSLAILALVAAAIVGYIIWHNHHNPSSATSTGSSNYAYVYKNLVSYSLAGQLAGNGIKLQIPAAFGVKDGTVDKYTSASYDQVYAPNGPLPQSFIPAQIAHFAVATNYNATPFTPSYKSSYEGTLTSDSGQTGLQDFVSQRLPTGYVVSIGDAKSFSSSNIANNAWVVDYTAKAGAGQNASILPNLTGEVVVALGKQTTYYLMLDAVSSNWQTNQNIWQQVTGSLKIDQ